MKFLLLIITTYFGVGIAADKPSSIDWCGLTCGGQKHTICEYGCDPNPKVQDCRKYTLSKDQKNAILQKHNELRNKIALGEDDRVPEGKRKVANMMALSYDETVAYPAECWSAHCDFNHDHCRITPEFIQVGQNLAVRGASSGGGCRDDILLYLANGWYETEIAMLTAKEEIYDKFAGGDWGHYTQLIWAETKIIGCAASEYVKKGKVCYLACNYAPQGNLLEEPIYLQGSPASKCPDGTKTNSKYKGLCGEIKEAKESSGSGAGGARRMIMILISPILSSVICFWLGFVFQ